MYELAVINNKRYKGAASLLYGVLVIASTAFLVLYALFSGMKSIIYNTKDTLDNREIVIYSTDRNNYKHIDISDELLIKINNLEYVDNIYSKCFVEPEIEECNFEYNGKKYHSKSYTGFDFNYSPLSNTDIEFYRQQGNKNEYYLLKSNKKASIYDVLIDENFMYYLGFDTSNILGQKIEYSIGGQVYTLNVYGVVNRSYFFTSGYDLSEYDEEQYKMYEEELEFSFKPIVFSKSFIEDVFKSYDIIENCIVDCVSAYDVIKIVDFIENNFNNYISSKYSIMIEASKKINYMVDFVRIILILVALASLLIVTFTINVRIQKQTDFLRIMVINGASKSKIKMFYFFQILASFVVALITYTFLSYVLSYAISTGLEEISFELTENTNNVFLIDIKTYLIYSLLLSTSFVLTNHICIELKINKLFGEESINRGINLIE